MAQLEKQLASRRARKQDFFCVVIFFPCKKGENHNLIKRDTTRYCLSQLNTLIYCASIFHLHTLSTKEIDVGFSTSTNDQIGRCKNVIIHSWKCIAHISPKPQDHIDTCADGILLKRPNTHICANGLEIGGGGLQSIHEKTAAQWLIFHTKAKPEKKNQFAFLEFSLLCHDLLDITTMHRG